MDSPKAGLDLEKELTCSICTELLYQPLTLLDCLHTFCGACLKEWFTFQAATAERSPNPPPPGTSILTCPSCRAPVRDTRHNATVVTLLDMFVTANPDKDRSAAEKEELGGKYKPGDQVLPKVNVRQRTAEERRAEDDDRRLIERVRELSLRDVGASSSSVPPRSRRRRDSRDDRTRTGRDQSLDSRHRRSHRPRGEDSSRQNTDQSYSESERRHRRSESRQRQIEHQSSIRSLIGAATGMSERDIEREIEDFARQIQEEGLLDGLDLDNIDLSRDDELSRRITEAYRRRQRDRARQESSRRTNPPASGYSASSRYAEASGAEPRRLVPDGMGRPRSRTRLHSRSASATSQSDERSRPPPSISSAALDGQDATRRNRRRTHSNGSRSATAPIFPTTTETARTAARSSTDLSLRTQTSDPLRPSFIEGRSSSTPAVSSPPPPAANPTAESASIASSATPTSFANRATHNNSQSSQSSAQPSSNLAEPATGRVNRSHRPADLSLVHSSVNSPNSSPTAPGNQRVRSQLYQEPSISCNRCNKQHIEYDVHYNCAHCANGQWNLCLDCYRAGKGCLHWLGFGYAAWNKWERARQRDNSLEKPHMLTASRYRVPRSIPGGADGRKTLTTEDPRGRLESGTFCSRCFAWTNECYWRCDICNEGDWGFCHDCVNQGKSCAHPLLPLAHEATQSTSGRSGMPRSPGRPPTATILTGPNASSIGPFKPLTFTTRCDICQDPISSVQQRYHCYDCKSSLVPGASPGDYDICTSCYANLVSQRQISYENGQAGWRRCFNGHRMAIVGFLPGKVGQWRYVAQELVGGHGLRISDPDNPDHQSKGLQKWSWFEGEQVVSRLVTKEVADVAPTTDGSTIFTPNFPPDGGVGPSATAKWSWYPQVGADDELLFPRGAEITEIEDVNGDWYFGTYMGARGLFPSPYVRLQHSSSS